MSDFISKLARDAAKKAFKDHSTLTAWRDFKLHANNLSYKEQKRFLLTCVQKVSAKHRWYGYYLVAKIAYSTDDISLLRQMEQDALSSGCPDEYLSEIGRMCIMKSYNSLLQDLRLLVRRGQKDIVINQSMIDIVMKQPKTRVDEVELGKAGMVRNDDITLKFRDCEIGYARVTKLDGETIYE